MYCRIADLRNKQVVCVKNGCVLGYICDVCVDVVNGKVTSVVVPGKMRFFGILGREDDIIIPWSEINVIGNETVLVNTEPPTSNYNRKNRFGLW